MLSTAFFKRTSSYLSSKGVKAANAGVRSGERLLCQRSNTGFFFSFGIPPPNKIWLPWSVPSSRVSCWSAVETHSTKSGRRSTWRWPMTASCPIIPASMWVCVSTQRWEGIRTTGKEQRVSNGLLCVLAGLHAQRPWQRDGPAESDSEGTWETAAPCHPGLRPPCQPEWTSQRRPWIRECQPRWKKEWLFFSSKTKNNTPDLILFIFLVYYKCKKEYCTKNVINKY